MRRLSNLRPGIGTRLDLADAALAALVIAVVGLMIVPLPTWLLDLLLATNLAASVAILLVALYVGNALRLATFPTLLLITTLVRLALNVSSTRLILLQAYAGEVIQSFGEFVVRGNYVVGGVIFLILTIIQFVVIAKGSERVAEVGARFTLDAMPGKQLAIDAELRSGSIDSMEANRRRRTLHRESQFYGAMDGAMKFVKGDVIASFLITIVNLVGGLAIGMAQRGLDPASALKRYGLLTIGDGLVTQIPALVIATASGVLVTRVASEDSETPLGAELASQLFGAPRALKMAAIFIILLAFVPGLPALPFLVIGLLLHVAAVARERQLRFPPARPPRPVRPDAGTEGGARYIPVVAPWSLGVSRDLGDLLHGRGGSGARAARALPTVATEIRERLFRELGVPLPEPELRMDAELPDRHVVLSIHEVPAKVIALSPELADDQLAAHLQQEVLPVLRDRAADFMGIAETQILLDGLRQVAPATVEQVVPRPISLPTLTEVLQRLVEEQISVRDLSTILESLVHHAATARDALTLTELVRSDLRRSITHQLTAGAHEVCVYLLDRSLEDTIRDAITPSAAGSFLTLAPAAGRDVVSALRNTINRVPTPSDVPPVLLTQPDVRRFVKKLVETELPALKVVSYSELLPEIAVHPLATATLQNL